MERFIIKSQHNGMRLDKVLVAFLTDKSRSFIDNLIDDGKCTVNGKVDKS